MAAGGTNLNCKGCSYRNCRTKYFCLKSAYYSQPLETPDSGPAGRYRVLAAVAVFFVPQASAFVWQFVVVEVEVISAFRVGVLGFHLLYFEIEVRLRSQLSHVTFEAV